MALGSLFVLGSVGAALMPYLAPQHPLLLLALSPWPRHQILVAPHTPFVPFMLVTVLRGLASAVVAYELARLYGPEGLARLEQRSTGTARFLRTIETAFRAAPVPLLVLAPGPITAAFAAVARMHRAVVACCLVVGLSGWAFVNYRLGGLFAPWTKHILDFIREHMLAATIVCTLAVALYELVRRKRRLRQLQKTQAELE